MAKPIRSNKRSIMQAMSEEKNNLISSSSKFKLIIKARNKRTMLWAVYNGIKPTMTLNAKPRLRCQGFSFEFKALKTIKACRIIHLSLFEHYNRVSDKGK